MRFMRYGRFAGVAVLSVAAALTACGRRQPVEVADITPSFEINRTRVPLGSAVEVTYTWTVGPEFQPLEGEHRALVHFLDSHQVMLFEDDHVPEPPPSEWQAGQTYTYRRTKFIPIYPYVGDVEVRTGLYPAGGRGERVALKGEDAGLREYVVGKVELLPQTENIFLVYKDGWHNPEALPDNPSLERTWTKKEAVVSFKNPGQDTIVYLEADTNFKAFENPPVLTVSVGETAVTIPIENSEVFLKKIRLGKDVLGTEEWVDLKLSMSDSFVPKDVGLNQDDRELGLLVYHLYVGEESELGDDLGEVIDAGAPAEAAVEEEAAE
jgi:hypothetical protein